MIQPTNAQLPIPQQGGANAVSINIFNPQAYGSAPQQAPYDYTNSVYGIPQNSVYNQGVQYYPQQYIPQMIPQGYVPQMMPQGYVPQMIPQGYTPQALPQGYMQSPLQQPVPAALPAPQVMPSSVLEVPQAQQPVQPTADVEVTAQPDEKKTVNVDTDTLINNLKSTDTKTREAAINKLAEYAQDEDVDVIKQVITEPIMQTLVDIISEDTSGLQGPTDEQVAVAEKVAKGEALTPEEDKISEELSPRDAANQNRMFALYTLAMLQKFQREEVDQYIAAQKANGQETIDPLKLENVYGYDGVVNVIKNDPRPEVKVAAIQSLRHVAQPEDEATVKSVLSEALNSTDEEVKAVAQETVDAVSAQ
ncbi:MAG: hypothetical protein IJ877_06070 [Candidatus Gastranaerophilales bacterium]|nr:hypothetical protein [Candidatus Gastranaerophilales bacterium]